MGLFNEIKDVANVLQQAGNIDLYKQVLGLCEQALEMQNKIACLQNENDNLKKELKIKDDIERQDNFNLFITLKNDNKKIKYCSHCWDAERKLIQIQCLYTGTSCCPYCKTETYYDKNMYEEYLNNNQKNA
jgi:thymidine phosphorylase